jgi:hypothetical protein
MGSLTKLGVIPSLDHSYMTDELILIDDVRTNK